MSKRAESGISGAGEHVRWYAQRYGWSLARHNIMVEGITDVRYLHLAARLYQQKHSKHLLDNLSIFAAGDGDQGGTPGIIERFPLLHRMIHLDVGVGGKALYRAIALLDNDTEGNKTCHYLTGRYTNLRENHDVFVLKRIFPRNTRDPNHLREQMKTANDSWKTLDCEIEDLIDCELIRQFLGEILKVRGDETQKC